MEAVVAPEVGPDVWVGLKRCGCCVGVCVDRPEHRKDVELTKRDFLNQGLSVVRASWNEWRTVHMPSLSSDCGHASQKGCDV